MSDDTVRSYLAALENACLFSGARRFSIRERRYFRNIRKYYISDIGLLNAGTGFREQDFHCIMENVIFNELLARGWYVDTGVVESREMRTAGSGSVSAGCASLPKRERTGSISSHHPLCLAGLSVNRC